jgi:hypothetical protein
MTSPPKESLTVADGSRCSCVKITREYCGDPSAAAAWRERDTLKSEVGTCSREGTMLETARESVPSALQVCTGDTQG